MPLFKNISKLQELTSKPKRGFRIVDDESLTKEEFVQAFQQVLDFVKKFEQQNMAEFTALKQAFSGFADKIKNDTGMTVEELKGQVAEMEKRLEKSEGYFKSLGNAQD